MVLTVIRAYGGIVNFDKGDSAIKLTATAIGANMGLRKSIFEKYGPYRTDLNRINDLLGGEDTEYCRRIMHAGECLMYAPRAVVYHPVEEYRTTRKFLRSMAFHYGRWSILVGGVPDGAKCFFGVPRYLFRWRCGFLGSGCFRARRNAAPFTSWRFFRRSGKWLRARGGCEIVKRNNR